ncbi:primosomal replication protein PriC [Buttiauxella agrestis]|uniref:Primosomal replication protein N n=2 Tax=Buttiauxella agrestis TaxID=82977 RepID=A0A085GI81_9ENTR|nr:primosomal replication protein [Buttiauxella agrestis]KFC83426.1 primosomal replication protein N'' [Buttiauxella agrestis ATCC 33320]BCG10480.1 prephenate dehydrogenase [Buttiauxella agrestis]SUW65048.1 Primosomal replication protein N'' [Buttiauxella agrestis]
MKTASLLQALNTRVAELAQAIAPVSLQRASQARFDSKLFSTHSTQLKDYLSEVQANLEQLQLSVKVGRTEQVAYLAEKLVAQIAALQRELATVKMRKNDPQPVVAENLYEKLSTHQDYERRIQIMISDRESQLSLQATLAGQQKLQKELAALEGRLQRCRQALTRIERAIERRERGLS